MAASLTFESQLQPGSYLQDLWDSVKPQFFEGKVGNREDAYVLFSRVLKITQTTSETESLNELWLKTLVSGRFFLCVEDEEPIEFNFHTIINLVNSGKTHFEIEIEEIDPTKNDLETVATSIHSICLSALGNPPPAAFFLQKLQSPNTFFLLAKHQENDVGCLYGTLIPFSRGNIFHFNILGRKIEYPSSRVLEKFSEKLTLLFQRFPKIDYFTLCVDQDNIRMIESYEKFGLEKLSSVEKGPMGTPVYFYGKKVDPNSVITPPTYEEFQEAKQKS